MRKYFIKNSIYGWFVCYMAAVFYCYEYILRILPSTITSELMLKYDITAVGYAQFATLYYISYSLVQVPAGILFDRYCVKNILSLSCILCVVGSYFFHYYDSYLIGLVSRFIIGFGSAFGFIGVLKLASVWLSPNRFAMISGITTALGMIGAMAGSIYITKYTYTVGIDVASNTLIICGIILTLMLYVCIVKKDEDIPSSSKRNFLKELKDVIKNKQVWLSGLIGLLLFSSLSVFAELWGGQYLISSGFTSIESSYMISMVYLGWAIGAPLQGWISDVIENRKKPIIINSILVIVTILIFILLNSKSILINSILLFLYGLFCSSEVIVFAISKESCPNMTGTAIAITNAIVMISGFTLTTLFGLILDFSWSSHSTVINGLHTYLFVDYQMASYLLPVSIIVSLILSFYIKENKT